MPRFYKQAMATPDSGLWKAAAETEMEHHRRNGSWRYVIPPAGAKVLPGMWVLTVKHNPDGSVARHKARYVVKGFSQRPGVDYTETFAPTFRQASLRLISALAAQHDLHMHSVDIPPGTVCALDKAIYGLKQASRQWNLKLHSARD